MSGAEVLYQNILSEIADAVFITDSAGAFTFVSANAERIFGYTVEEIWKFGYIFKLWENIFFENNLLESSLFIENIEWKITDKWGNKRTLLANVKRVSIEGGTLLYVCRDITSIEQAQEGLDERDRSFRRIFENAPIGMAVFSSETYQFVKVNAAFCEMLGYSETELTAFSLWAVTHPEDRETDWHWAAQSETGTLGGCTIEKRFIKKNKEILWANLTLTGIEDEKGATLYELGTIEDISERKQIEEELRRYRDRNKKWMQVCTADSAAANQQLVQEIRVSEAFQKARTAMQAELHAILNNTVEGFALIERDFSIRAFNLPLFQAIQHLMGKQMRRGHSILEYIFEESKEDFCTAFASALSGEQIKGERKITESLWIEYHFIPVRESSGEIVAVSFSQVDVTARKRAEEARRESEQRLATIAANIPGVVYRLILHGDGSLSIPYISAGLQESIGIGAESMMARPEQFLERVHPEDRLGLEAALASSAKTLARLHHECRLIATSGLVKWVCAIARVEVCQSGDIVFDGLLLDITARKIAEEALQESEAENRALIAAIPDALFRIRSDGTYVDFIPACNFEPFLLPHEFLGKNVADVLPEAIAIQTLEAIAIACQTESLQVVEFQMPVKGYLHDYEARIAVSDRFEEVLSIVRDITPRKQAERALRQQMQWTEQILQTTMDGFVALSVQGRILEANPAFCAIVGYSRSQLLNMHVCDLQVRETCDETTCQIEAIARTGSARFETQYRCQNGQIIDVEASAIFTQIQDERFLFTFVRDITEGKKRQEELQLFKAIIETSNEAIAVSNPYGQIIYANSAMEKLFKRALVREKFLDYRDYYPPESIEIFQREVAPALARGCGWEGELDARDARGSRFPVWQRADSILNAEGKTLYFFSLMHDISDRKQVEAALRRQAQIIDQIHDAVISTDINGYITSWNRGAERLYGYQGSEAIGKKVSFIYPPNSEEFLQEQVLQPLNEKGSHELEMLNLTKCGKEIWVGLFLSQLLDSAGNLVGAIGYAIDITERKAAEEKLRKSEANLAEAQKIARVGSWELDVKTQKLTFSEELFRILGLDPARLEPLYSELLQKLDPAARILLESYVEAAIAEGQPYQFECRYVLADGSVRYLMTKGQPFLNDEGKVTRLFGTIADISDRKQAEFELSKREREFRTLAENTPDTIARLDNQLRHVYVNRAFEGVTGLSPQAFIGKTYRELGFPEEQVSYWEKVMRQVIETGQEAAIEFYLPIERVQSQKISPSKSHFQEVKTHNKTEFCWDRNLNAENQPRKKRKKILNDRSIIQLKNKVYLKKMRKKILNVFYEKKVKNLEYRYYQTRIVPEFAVTGTVEFILCTTRDITERKKMEVSLQLARARLHHLLAASPAVIYSCKPDGEFNTTFMGDNVSNILGYEAREFLEDVNFWTERLHPEDVKRVVAEMQQVLQTEYDTYEYRFRHKDGSYRWMYDRVHLVRDASGNPLEIVGSWIDITERKQAEEQLICFSKALAAASDGIVMADMTSQSTYHNQAFLLMFGYTPEELNAAGGLRVLFADEMKAGEVFDTIMAGGYWSGEVKLRSRVGTVRDILLRAYAIEDNAQARIGLVSICTDISDRKSIQEELAIRAAELARSNAELEQFAYVASHDLQEPLRMVASYAQLLARRYSGQLDAKADTYIAYAVEGAQRMQQLIEDLLQYSRVGRRSKAFVPVDCREVLHKTLANLQLAIRESGALVNVAALPVVKGDDIQLVQLFQNLIGNAIKYRGERAPVVEVCACRRDNAWLFEVRDNGIGLEPKHGDRIFLIFQRLHTREEYPGTGIGLAICKKIVERHGGCIWVESQPGIGATFYFTIPDSEAPSN